MFEPIWESIAQVRKVPTVYTAAAVRTVRQSFGTRRKSRTPKIIGSAAEPKAIGCVPEKGKSQEERATTTTGASPRAYAPGRRLLRKSAAAATPRKRPATGLHAVASPASGAATTALAQRLRRQRCGQQKTAATAPSANSMPRPKVTRPDRALQRKAKTPATAQAIGLRTARTRTRISAVSAADRVPVIIIVVRTPSTDIRYGETTLYETGCIPPYQARLYAESGCRPTNSAHASCAARSPPLLAKRKNQRTWVRAASPVATMTV